MRSFLRLLTADCLCSILMTDSKVLHHLRSAPFTSIKVKPHILPLYEGYRLQQILPASPPAC